jgi:hypothetical protein
MIKLGLIGIYDNAIWRKQKINAKKTTIEGG